jgi:hypothetical protein
MSDKEHNLKAKSPSLQAFLRSLSKFRFESLSQKTVERVVDHPNPDGFLYGSHQTIIQVASKDLRITFKSHFTVASTIAILKEKRASHPRKALHDLFMEYSNLVAGGISQQLHDNGVICGISLPIATGGFDELIASDVLGETSYFDYWLVGGETFAFTCTVVVDLLDDIRLESLRFSNEGFDLGGELEFL